MGRRDRVRVRRFTCKVKSGDARADGEPAIGPDRPAHSISFAARMSRYAAHGLLQLFRQAFPPLRPAFRYVNAAKI
jgi:hypothetical protein